MPELPYQLERTVVIKAKPETVFRFFTDSARWAGWWGAGSTIDSRPGGKVYIRHPGGCGHWQEERTRVQFVGPLRRVRIHGRRWRTATLGRFAEAKYGKTPKCDEGFYAYWKGLGELVFPDWPQ